MQVTTTKEITVTFNTGDCFRDFCFSSAGMETERFGTYEKYHIDITAPMFDTTPELRVWTQTVGVTPNTINGKPFTTEYQTYENRSESGSPRYRERDTELASTTIGSDELSFEPICRALQKLADRAYELDTGEMPGPTGDTDE